MTSFTDVLLLFNTDSNTLEKVWDEVECIIDGEEFDDWSDDKTVKISNLITQAQEEQPEAKKPEENGELNMNELRQIRDFINNFLGITNKSKQHDIMFKIKNRIETSIKRYGNDGMGNKPKNMTRLDYWIQHLDISDFLE